MIYFRKIRFKNLLSYGNYFTEIDLTGGNINVITATNGSGKTAFLDAIVFALFGRPYRKINKPSLINSINEKNLISEVEFDVGGKSYFVRRGMKPAIFEIYENGKKLDESDSVKDQQKYFEENILKTSYRSFLQIVILGANNYIPFMELRSQQRREFIEQLLDIDIFSTMNELLKGRISKLKSVEQELNARISNVEHEIETQQNFIQKLENERNEQTDSIDKEISEFQDEIQKKETEINELDNSISNIDKKISEYNVSEPDQEIKKTNKEKAQYDNRIKTLNEDIQTIRDNSTCPTCTQEITTEHRNKTIQDWQNKIRYFEEQKSEVSEREKNLQKTLDDIKKLTNERQDLSMKLKVVKSDIDRHKREIERLNNKKTNVRTEDIEEEKNQLKNKENQKSNLNDKKKIINQKRMLFNVATDLLKDTGIKSRIVSQYVPIMNKLINQYLSIMGYPITFTLDQNFDEQIYSRHRESFRYDNFSEGEKQRIDIALLMTWRDIARMKNSVSTNLLILDEVFDSSLDSSGMENYLSVLDELKDSNVYIISHRLQSSSVENADRILYVEKKKDFSYISDSNGNLLLAS